MKYQNTLERARRMQEDHEKVRASMNSEQLRVAELSDREFEESDILKDVMNFDSEKRVRKAGFTPQEAEDVAYIIKKKQIGEIFEYKNKQLVLTPFKTVVSAQIYLTTIQDRFLELTSVTTELEIAELKKTIQEFTSLSFFGLIKLAFKQKYILLKGKING